MSLHATNVRCTDASVSGRGTAPVMTTGGSGGGGRVHACSCNEGRQVEGAVCLYIPPHYSVCTIEDGETQLRALHVAGPGQVAQALRAVQASAYGRGNP